MIEGAPGHGEGHNSGVPLNITAAIAVKRIMQREKLAGTLVLWPGVAEEQLAPRRITSEPGFSKTLMSSFTPMSAPTWHRLGRHGRKRSGFG